MSSAVQSAASSIAGGVLGMGAGAVFDAAGQWVSAGASWFLEQLVTVVSATTAPPIGTAWFTGRLAVMAAIGAAVVVPLMCAAAVQAIMQQNPGALVRMVVVHLPIAVGLTGTAVALVQMGLSITDTLSQQVLSSAGTTVSGSLSPISKALGGSGGSSAPSFAILLGAVVVAVAAIGLWLEMAVRSAAVSVTVLFLPLVMATLVWPAVSQWCRRLADTIVALVVSKLVIVAVLALATAALGNGSSGSTSGGFSSVITGAALLVVACMSPFTLMRLIPAIEAGAVAQLEQARHHLRQAAGAPRRAALLATDLLGAGAGGASTGLDDAVGMVGPVDPGNPIGGGGVSPGGGLGGGDGSGGGADGGGADGGGGGSGGGGSGAGSSDAADRGVRSGGGRPVGLTSTGGAGNGGRSSARNEDGRSGSGFAQTTGTSGSTGMVPGGSLVVSNPSPAVIEQFEEAARAGVAYPDLGEAVRRRTAGGTWVPAEAGSGSSNPAEPLAPPTGGRDSGSPASRVGASEVEPGHG